MVEARGGRRFAVAFLGAALLVLLLGRWLKPVDSVAVSAEAPFAAVVNSAANAIGDKVSGVFQGPGLYDQNQQLRKAMALLLRENIRLQQEQHENQLLRSALRYQSGDKKLRMLMATVIASEPNGISPFVLINKGTRDGLVEGMTVVDQNGYFVGSITEIMSNAARVELMTNPSSSVSALDLRTRAVGLVQGQYAGMPQLQYVLTSAQVRPQDLLITSGQCRLFPPGLLIGQVTRVVHRNVNEFQTATIEPAADFSHLEIVQVVRNFIPQCPYKLFNNP